MNNGKPFDAVHQAGLDIERAAPPRPRWGWFLFHIIASALIWTAIGVAVVHLGAVVFG